MVYKVITSPNFDAVSLAEVKAQLNIESGYTDDDTYLSSKIAVWTKYVEDYCKIILRDSVIECRINPIGDVGVFIPSPATAINTITFYKDGISDTVDVANYEINTFSDPHVIAPKYGYEWPENDYIVLNLDCGYADGSLPQIARDAIIIKVAEAYDNRGNNQVHHRNDVSEMLKMIRIPTI